MEGAAALRLDPLPNSRAYPARQARRPAPMLRHGSRAARALFRAVQSHNSLTFRLQKLAYVFRELS